jgi:hypothetical protein
MKNTECVIYITTKRGWTQTYLKEKEGWTQTGPNGIVRRMSAEQLLSHLLPPLAAGSDRLSVRVERRTMVATDPEVDSGHANLPVGGHGLPR